MCRISTSARNGREQSAFAAGSGPGTVESAAVTRVKKRHALWQKKHWPAEQELSLNVADICWERAVLRILPILFCVGVHAILFGCVPSYYSIFSSVTPGGRHLFRISMTQIVNQVKCEVASFLSENKSIKAESLRLD